MTVQEVRVVDLNGDALTPLSQDTPTAVYSASGVQLYEFGFNRPNDTTAYTSGDVFNQSTTIPNLSHFDNVPQSGIILGINLIDSINAATVLQSELWLYDQPVLAGLDNVAWSPVDGDQVRNFGVVPFVGYYVGGATDGSGASTVYPNPNLNIAYALPPGTTSIYAVPVARNAYTPAALERFFYRMWIGQL